MTYVASTDVTDRGIPCQLIIFQALPDNPICHCRSAVIASHVSRNGIIPFERHLNRVARKFERPKIRIWSQRKVQVKIMETWILK